MESVQNQKKGACLSRGELLASKWCRRTKDDRLKKEGKGRNLTRVVSHVTSYPARSRDRSCDRYTVTTTRPSHPWPGHVPGHVPSHVLCHVPGYVMSHVPSCDGTFDHGNLLRPLALRHSRRPLALWYLWPLLPFGPWPLFPRGQHPSSTLADGGLRLLAASNPWRPLAHGAPLATISYQGVVVIRNGRVIKPIVRGGGHGGRGGHSGLGGMKGWCGGMS